MTKAAGRAGKSPPSGTGNARNRVEEGEPMNQIFKVAIVEDNPVGADNLKEMFTRYGKEAEVLFDLTVFDRVEKMLDYRRGCFDLVMMDIDLPGMNGMEGARRLREADSMVTIIFVTNLAQFAVKGYEVSALDFLVKPVSYKNFSVKLSRAVSVMRMRQDKKIVVCGKTEKNCIGVHDILYVEVQGHQLCFHKTDGSCVEVTGTLSALEKELHDFGFSLCNSCYLVNLKYVIKIDTLSVTLADGTKLQTSVRKRKSFLDEFTTFLGSGGTP